MQAQIFRDLQNEKDSSNSVEIFCKEEDDALRGCKKRENGGDVLGGMIGNAHNISGYLSNKKKFRR